MVILSMALLACTAPVKAQERFNTTQDAVTALVDAAKAQDKKDLFKVLGPKGQQIVSSGDPVADRAVRDKFVTAYDTKHSITQDGDDSATLVIGDDDWPFPIPIVRKHDGWSFDTKAGLDEILRRRIGRDELSAIQVSLAYVQAQNEYASLNPDGLGPHVYAQHIVSSPGKKDGLYWPTADGEEPSPLGDLAAQASAEGYKVGQKPIPYHGYFYRILKRQGASATGGAYDYVVNGKMIGGFALLAYPAEYGNSGIMTFIVNQDGTVFQRDLGERTEKIARKIETFDPDAKWTKVDAQP
ncbi:DUF2950 domain-containing protein [Methyloceanibacter sp.]|uniref:DUF2950 domain-containing protein n=1 Tax=Methyloceanibacter sp. TaxID=1965321 RepID=UPI003D6C9A5D